MTSGNKNTAISERIQSDPHAPHYHFIAPEGDCLPFDPNGAIFWKGKYHLFYIFQDKELPYGGHCWGHASSRDLINWTFHKPALVPAEEDPERGIFSGNAFVNKDGIPTLIYHGVGAGTCIATAKDDELIEWEKSPHNPVIKRPEKGSDTSAVYNVFDPHCWLEGDTYNVILGGRVKPHEVRDTAYLFQSSDLVNWEYIRPFYNPHPHWTDDDEDCACPDFFKLGDRHVLMCISHTRGTRFYFGRYHKGTFIPDEHHRLNWMGGPCFASESLIDDRGRRILWAWLVDQRDGKGSLKRELGVMTMPRVLSIEEQGHLLIDPADEMKSLRYNERVMTDLLVQPGMEVLLDGFEGNVMEIEIKASIQSRGVFGIKVCKDPEGNEQTTIIVDSVSHTLTLDTSCSSLHPDIFQRYPIIGKEENLQDVPVQTAPFQLNRYSGLQLRVFIDRSVLEVFANRRQCMSQRIYPTLPESVGLAVFSLGQPTTIHSIKAWDMYSSNSQTVPVDD